MIGFTSSVLFFFASRVRASSDAMVLLQIASTQKVATVPEVKGPRSISFGPDDWRLCDSYIQGNIGDSDMRYFGVTEADDGSGKKVDLVVKIDNNTKGNTYKGKTEANGKEGCFGAINMMSGTKTAFNFGFYLSGTSTPYTMKSFPFTIYDIDAANVNKDKGSETVTFNTPPASFEVTGTTELSKSGDMNAGSLTFAATQNGKARDNPSDPESLNQAQLDRAVKVQYVGRSEFTITFGVTRGNKGRNIFFAGQSNLLIKGRGVQTIPPPPRCDPSANKMKFSKDRVSVSDLGNTNITFNDVTDGINLVVTTHDTYQAHNPAVNGVNEGGFGIINLKSGTSSTMHFALVDKSNSPRTLEYLYLTFYDVDQYKTKSFEILKICTGSESFTQLHLPKNPELDTQSDGAGCYTIKSTADGLDAPVSTTEIGPRQKANSFTLAFSRLQSFDATFEILHLKGKPAGRNFMFSGDSAFCTDEVRN